MGNHLCFLHSYKSEIRWVFLMWFSQVHVLTTACEVEVWNVKIDIIINTTSPPWVKFTLGENDIGVVHKVLPVVITSESIKSPVILWS